MCLSRVALDTGQLWVLDGKTGMHRPLDLPSGINPDQKRRRLRLAKVRCPNQIGEYPEHYLPYHYVDQAEEPVVIAMVGASASGKTHLLAAMIGKIHEQGLRGFGLSVSPLDIAEYEHFTSTHVRPFLMGNAVLLRTNHDVWEFVIGLTVEDTDDADSPPRAVVFFDISGDGMSVTSHIAKHAFFDVVDGFIFVVSPEDLERDDSAAAFSAVLDLVKDKEDKAAVVVLAKADQCRFDYPVDRWLREEEPTLDPARIREESRDIYSYIVGKDKGAGYLRPWTEVGRVALHAASATGAPSSDDDTSRYARPVRPRRTVQPFLSLMAMTGVKKGAEAGKVGD
ncbi:hypothetical protein BJF83_20570 [Nocardiopsis sp. CNR-923]|nr:hypothetical protein BJF83_20570 [Nocardiopsis sp. CNR-923]